MDNHRHAVVWAACLVALALGCTRDTNRAELDAGVPDAGDSEPIPHMVLVPPLEIAVNGYEDLSNRYIFTVAVGGDSAPGETGYRECAGVLIASNLALTAAHCLCTPTRGETTRYDGSKCAVTAMVRFYDLPPWDDGHRPLRVPSFPGKVQVHPQFEIVLDAHGAVVTSRADFALVRLTLPPPPGFPPVRLGTKEARPGELLWIVGFGYTGTPKEPGSMDYFRRFTQDYAQKALDYDRLGFLMPPHPTRYLGETGGPCLRETKQGVELVGISQRGLGVKLGFTRIAPYREWLDEQIRLAKEAR